jgi:hypothetical protein
MKRITLFLALLVLAALACGSPDNSGVTAVPRDTAVPVDEGEAEAPEPGPDPTAAIETFGVGETIEVVDHNISLNTLEIQGNRIVANFTIENKGSTDLNISSILSFEARDDNGSQLEQDIFDCGTSSMGGSILPNDKLTGSICWDGLTTDTGKIYYRAELFGSGAIVWAVSK